eukprot:m.359570 g.359570  ORF g.359570 m.359570 type:complete len:77 (+) comp20760_c0_seq3:63-293(+)
MHHSEWVFKAGYHNCTKVQFSSSWCMEFRLFAVVIWMNAKIALGMALPYHSSVGHRHTRRDMDTDTDTHKPCNRAH